MNLARKWRKPALVLVTLVVVTQGGISLLVQTHGVHHYLVTHLERSFGRPVEVRRFNAFLFPAPVLDAEQITVSEDPAFGNEYFLRADHLTAGLRWAGLLRGHFEFGTLSLSRPSLVLVHNSAGSWNLERWLPPAKASSGNIALLVYGALLSSTPTNHLQKIDIDDGRIDFKSGVEKLPFAFVSLSGSVEQVSTGRWRLQIEAQPWRSGVTLQSAGTLTVRGDVAGTSTRLQPAEIHVHWGEASLADVLRLLQGRDYGVRGTFAVDGVAKSGAGANLRPSDWMYSLQARATQIHRWDLTERRDNPAVNLDLEGHWNAAARNFTAEKLVVQTPKSNLRGSMHVAGGATPFWEVRVDSAGIQASDALCWYRAFQPGVDEQVTAEQFFTGSLALRGWPLELEDAAFSSQGGVLRVPGINLPLKISGFAGGRQRSRLIAGPIRLAYDLAGLTDVSGTANGGAAKRRATPEGKGSVEITFIHDFAKHAGAVSLDGRLEKTEDALAFTAAFGHVLNHGWELSGPLIAALQRNWDALPLHTGWNGHIDIAKGSLQAAGLNQPLGIAKARLDWTNGTRSAQISEVDGFGALWSGQITQAALTDVDFNPKWNFQLHADHLNAADLDRWAGPRARPGWLWRLLPSLLGRFTAQDTPPVASELLRRINAEGQLTVDDFKIEKIHLSHVHANLSLRELQLDVRSSTAQWAGGKVAAKFHAAFFPRPSYDVAAQFDRINLAQLPATDRSPEPFAGLASGTLHLATKGLGRDELLQNLVGKGEANLRDVQFDGWDISASVAEGQPRAGISRWSRGTGAFTIRDHGIVLSGLRLEGGPDLTLIKGTVNFGRETDLSIQVTGSEKSEGAAAANQRILKVSGPLDLPRLSVQKLVARQPAD